MRRLAPGLLALCLAAPAGAASPSDALDAAGADVAAAVAALGASEAPQERVAGLSRAISAFEAALADLRGAVFDAEARERALTLDLATRRGEISRLLATLQALRRVRASALHPEGPLAAARAAAIVTGMTPAYQREAAALTDQLTEMEAARAARARGMAQLSGGLVELAAARGALLQGLDRRRPREVDPDMAVASRLARDTDNLSALAATLAARDGGAAVPGAPLPLAWPVAGAELRAYGAPDAAGVRRPGLLVEAAPLSVVTAPAEARVRYAGPFLDYGYVVALEPRADVIILLAGLATLEIRSGDVVPTGGLLGLLGGRALDAQEYLMLGGTGTGATPAETLYIEIRHGTGPVDPASWFTDRNG